MEKTKSQSWLLKEKSGNWEAKSQRSSSSKRKVRQSLQITNVLKREKIWRRPWTVLKHENVACTCMNVQCSELNWTEYTYIKIVLIVSVNDLFYFLCNNYRKQISSNLKMCEHSYIRICHFYTRYLNDR